MAKHSGFRAVVDRRRELRSRANRVGEVVLVELGQPIIANSVQGISLGRGSQLLHDLVLEIVENVSVAIDDHAAVRAEHQRSARAIVEAEAIAALALPDDALVAVEYEGCFLGVGELPVVGVVKATAGRDYTPRIIDAEQPPSDVDLVGAVVADL